MKNSGTAMRRRIAGACIGGVLGGVAAATIAAPTAMAAPAGCSAGELASTVSNVTGSARTYLDAHPGANRVLTDAATQPRPVASSNVRAYFTSNPTEYYELKGIVSPIGDKQRQCNVSLLSPELSSAYDEFMRG